MIKWLKKGFVSVELVIMSAIILTSGILGVTMMGNMTVGYILKRTNFFISLNQNYNKVDVQFNGGF